MQRNNNPSCEHIASVWGTLLIEWCGDGALSPQRLVFCDRGPDDIRYLSPAALLLQQWINAGQPQPCPLPVRFPAGSSEFRQRVWRALMSIPPGKTHTYTELAALIGQPTAARAVASACAANQLALLVPCHRIVPACGGVGQYRWGAERKQRLLQAEGAF